MPKTQKISCQNIAEWLNVSQAFYSAAKGKMKHHAVRQALKKPEETINQVSYALAKGELPVGGFHSFEIHDPKQRTIHAAPFVDRIAHHAIINVLEPTLERVLLDSVFACRPNKGVHKAIYYAQKQARRFKWVMHIDIKHYFPNIDHEILKQQLRKRFRGDGLRLIESVIDAHQTENVSYAKGLPIGSLTSQHFANHYLNRVDRWSLSQPDIKAHCRYMDDFLFWADSKQALLSFLVVFEKYLDEIVKLSIKPAVIQPTKISLLFCGIRIRPFRLQASARRKQRYLYAKKKWEDLWHTGVIDSYQLQNAYASINAILLPADEKNFRKKTKNWGGCIIV